MKVLLIEDTYLLRITTGYRISDRDIEPLSVGDIDEALEALRQHSDIDLIICDGMEGGYIDVWNSVDRRRGDRTIPMVLYTNAPGRYESEAERLGIRILDKGESEAFDAFLDEIRNQAGSIEAQS